MRYRLKERFWMIRWYRTYVLQATGPVGLINPLRPAICGSGEAVSNTPSLYSA
jgi:hypothetical protein